MDKKNNLALLSLVAIVAVVGVIGLVMQVSISNSASATSINNPVLLEDETNLAGQASWVETEKSNLDDGILWCHGSCGVGGPQEDFGIQVSTCNGCTCQSIGDAICEDSSWVSDDYRSAKLTKSQFQK